MYEICSKLPIKTIQRRHRRCSAVFIVNFKQISQIVVTFIAYFEQVNADWVLKQANKLARIEYILRLK